MFYLMQTIPFVSVKVIYSQAIIVDPFNYFNSVAVHMVIPARTSSSMLQHTKPNLCPVCGGGGKLTFPLLIDHELPS